MKAGCTSPGVSCLVSAISKDRERPNEAPENWRWPALMGSWPTASGLNWTVTPPLADSFHFGPLSPKPSQAGQRCHCHRLYCVTRSQHTVASPKQGKRPGPSCTPDPGLHSWLSLSTGHWPKKLHGEVPALGWGGGTGTPSLEGHWKGQDVWLSRQNMVPSVDCERSFGERC